MQFVFFELLELTLNRTIVTVTAFYSDNLGFKWTSKKRIINGKSEKSVHSILDLMPSIYAGNRGICLPGISK